MKCDFSLKHYEECIQLAKDNGYTFLTFGEHSEKDKYEKIIFLRHDVDFCIDLAKQMFEIEKRLGVKSTFFLRIHSYNLFSLEAYSFVKELLNSGFEIGFHYTEEFARLMNENPEEVFKRELEAFEAVIGKKILGVCKHLPSRTKSFLTEDFFISLGLKYDAYNLFFTKTCKYLSESAHYWREGCMCEWIGKVNLLCILTHPMWWYDKSPIENTWGW